MIPQFKEKEVIAKLMRVSRYFQKMQSYRYFEVQKENRTCLIKK